MRTLVTIAIFAALACSCQAESFNLIYNGDFGKGLEGWSTYNDTALYEPASGEWGWFAWPATSGGAMGGIIIQGAQDSTGAGIKQRFFIGDSNSYTLNYRFGYTNIGGVSGVQFRWYDANDAYIGGMYYSDSFRWDTQPDPNPTDGVYSNNSNNYLYGPFSVYLKANPVTFTRGFDNGNQLYVPVQARYAEIWLLQYSTGYRTYFDDVSFTPIPSHCGDPGTTYLQGDFNKDCKVNLKDFASFAAMWLECVNPTGICN